MLAIRTVALGAVLAALSVSVLPGVSYAYTPEEQAACQPDAFRLCGAEIPNIERVTACMVARRAELSPECKRFFRSDPPEPAAMAAPPVGRPVNIRPKAAKHGKPVAAKPVSTKKPASAKKPATPKTKKPAKRPTAT
jgi:hypothetical protein